MCATLCQTPVRACIVFWEWDRGGYLKCRFVWDILMIGNLNDVNCIGVHSSANMIFIIFWPRQRHCFIRYPVLYKNNEKISSFSLSVYFWSITLFTSANLKNCFVKKNSYLQSQYLFLNNLWFHDGPLYWFHSYMKLITSGHLLILFFQYPVYHNFIPKYLTLQKSLNNMTSLLFNEELFTLNLHTDNFNI